MPLKWAVLVIRVLSGWGIFRAEWGDVQFLGAVFCFFDWFCLIIFIPFTNKNKNKKYQTQISGPIVCSQMCYRTKIITYFLAWWLGRTRACVFFRVFSFRLFFFFLLRKGPIFQSPKLVVQIWARTYPKPNCGNV